MAVTTFGEIQAYPFLDASDDPDTSEFVRTTVDAFRFVHSESLEELTQRARELEDLLDEGLAVVLAELLKKS
jgi:hypothetical protein